MIPLQSENSQNNETFKQNIQEQVSSVCIPVNADFEQQVACPKTLRLQIPSEFVSTYEEQVPRQSQAELCTNFGKVETFW